MLNGRAHIARRVVAGASLSALAITLTIQSVSHAEPSIEEVEQRVGGLYHEAEAAQERLNDIRYQMKGKKDRLAAIKSDLKRQRTVVNRMGESVATAIAAQAQGENIGATTRLLLADESQVEETLNGIVASESFNQHQGQLLTEFASASDKLELREQQVEAELAELAADKKQIAKENKTVEANLAEAKDLLAELEAEQREQLRIEHAEEEQPSRAEERTPVTNVAASGNAGVAVDFAMDQVGEAYVYGAAGPDAWDCSGLTMKAWEAAGVSLPHSSSAQKEEGTPVSYSELQPGDLVFYYDPVSHVGMYIGDGKLVHAANPETGVEVTDVDSMPKNGAVRPG